MLNLIPAYGRDYKSQAAVQADLDAGKDFAISAPGWGRRLVNRSQLHSDGHKVVYVRYAKQRKVAAFTVKEP